jgi:ribose/xylose/arabinose/galactoside ABC-type transport system permease subunit
MEQAQSQENSAHRQDMLCVGLLIAMALALATGLNPQDGDRYRSDVLGQMTSYWLLPAMGFLLALRCGLLDLSVWMVFSTGSLAAAWLIVHGWPPIVAMVAAMLTGAALGGINAILVRHSRVPSAIVTLMTTLGIFLLLRRLMPHWILELPVDAWNGWHGLGSPWADGNSSEPLFQVRILLVILFYALTMLTILFGGYRKIGPAGGVNQVRWEERRMDERTLRGLAMIASGALSALGGVLWLLDNPTAATPMRPIGELQVLVAPVLAGALLLKGPRRTLLAGVCLPPALMLTTAWRQSGWGLEYQGYSLQLLLLLAGAGLMALSGRATLGPGRRDWFMTAAILAGGAVTVLCVSTNFEAPLVLAALRWTGAGMLIAGAGVYCTGRGSAGPDVG